MLLCNSTLIGPERDRCTSKMLIGYAVQQAYLEDARYVIDEPLASLPIMLRLRLFKKLSVERLP